jgi:N-acyl-D-aspartate/D-glutamate deacylase
MSETAYDLVIRGGLVVDGSGSEPKVGDIALIGDRIAAVGRVEGRGAEEIDATDRLVTPGFVDIHTHYDGQVIWEERLAPSSSHGVTTVVIGSCGVGFAPCKPADRERLVKLMEGVEDLPEVVLTKGLTWEWESFGQYLDAIESRPHDIDVASFLPHSPLRVFVMGERAAAGEPSTPEDRARMAALAREAARAGALGFTTSRTLFHRSSSGDIIPTLDAEENELSAVAKAMGEVGDSLVEVATDYKTYADLPGEFELMERVSLASGQTISLPLSQNHFHPEAYREVLRLIEQANDKGAKIHAQVMPRGIGMLMGLDLTYNPFSLTPAYQEIADLPLAERVERMRDPSVRARIISEKPLDPSVPMAAMGVRFASMFEVDGAPDYEPLPSTSIAARAAAAGVTPQELAYDVLLKEGGYSLIYLPIVNYAHGSLEAVRELLEHKDVVLGLGDGGAHCGMICDAAYSTFLLSYWARDRRLGPQLPLARVVKALTSDTALAVGLGDRGRLAPGYKADVNIIDHEGLRLHRPQSFRDLPGGGRRLIQKADGYVATIVNGQVVYRDGEPTGALPGRLVRGRQDAPAA